MSKNVNYKRTNSYIEGYTEGVLLGSASVLVDLIRKNPDFAMRMEDDELLKDMVREIVDIIKKYPGYSKEHLTKRVIFESTYLLGD